MFLSTPSQSLPAPLTREPRFLFHEHQLMLSEASSPTDSSLETGLPYSASALTMSIPIPGHPWHFSCVHSRPSFSVVELGQRCPHRPDGEWMRHDFSDSRLLSPFTPRPLPSGTSTPPGEAKLPGYRFVSPSLPLQSPDPSASQSPDKHYIR